MISGVAGDMLVASLLAFEDKLSKKRISSERNNLLTTTESNKDWLIKKLACLVPNEEIILNIKKVKPGGLLSLQIDFKTREDDWYKSNDKSDKNNHDCHRSYSDIKDMIEKSSFSDQIKAHSIKTFKILAKAEGNVHGIDYRKVHFHEVGSLDAIIEVCGFFLLLEKWNITKVTSTPLMIGSGTVKCAHGLMPVPVPAVLNMITTHQIPYKKLSWETGELTTPTGLAILLGSDCRFESKSKRTSIPPQQIGYGAGHKKIPGLVNLLRTTLYPRPIQSKENNKQIIHNEIIYEIKVNLDDMTGEEIASLVEDIFSLGALDVCQYPVYMKKNRPGIVMEILCDEEVHPKIGKHLLTISSTLGYRFSRWKRKSLSRRQIVLEHRGHRFIAKEVTLLNGQTRIKVENDSLRSGLAKLTPKIAISRQELIEELNKLYLKTVKKTSQ